MQSIPIYLYPNITDVILDLDSTVLGVNEVMYQRDLKIQKGVKNQIQIQFKNSDQKRINVSNTGTYLFNMFDSINQRLLISKPLTVLDDGMTLSLRGLAQLDLYAGDTINLDSTSYTYSITYQDPTDNTLVAAYSNTYYGINGTLHLYEDIYPKLIPSQEVTSFLRTYNPGDTLYYFPSGNLYAYPEFHSNNAALHTIALYMTNYIGTVTIQGTLSNQPDSVDWYSTIANLSYNNFTGIDYYNFNGIYSYIRVFYTPATAPGGTINDNPAYYGSFDKLLYRA
jgi:hypothetical protein